MALISRKKIRNIYIKLIKQSGSPDFVARGVAIGFFIAFLIPIGFQMVIAFSLAWLLKGKKIPALACTWITNPWTVIVIYPVQCFVGSKILGNPLTFNEINESLKSLIQEPSWASFNELGMDIMIPFLLGGAIFGIITGVISYFAAYGMIISHRNRQEARLTRRLAAQAEWKSTLETKRSEERERENNETAES